MNIIPQLKESSFLENQIQLTKELSINYGYFSTFCTEAFFQRSGLKLGEGIPVELQKSKTANEEEYILRIQKKKIIISASHEKGIIQAFTTLYKLIKNNSVPLCKIHDFPEYPYRGLSLDSARHFYPAEEIKKIIEGISLCKLNKLHWHLSDDQGFRIELKKYPELTTEEYYPQEEILDIVHYASQRGVDIIPEIDMPGHVSAILHAHPEFGCFNKPVDIARKGGIYPIIFCPGKEEVFTFIRNVIEELVLLFPYNKYHIGGDEAPKGEWESCPACQKIREQYSLASPSDEQGYFTERVISILKEHQKEAICWNESLLASNMNAAPTIQYWTLQYRKEMEEAVQKGFHWIYSDMFELYFDYPYSMTSLKKVYDVDAHLGKEHITKGLDGFECCLWSEHIQSNEHLEKQLFPRVAAFSEIAYSKSKDYSLFEKTLIEELPLLEKAGLQITPFSHWNPQGKERKKEAIGYFVSMSSGMENRNETVKAAKPNKEFAEAFIKKFFHTSDLPSLLIALMKGK